MPESANMRALVVSTRFCEIWGSKALMVRNASTRALRLKSTITLSTSAMPCSDVTDASLRFSVLPGQRELVIAPAPSHHDLAARSCRSSALDDRGRTGRARSTSHPGRGDPFLTPRVAGERRGLLDRDD